MVTIKEQHEYNRIQGLYFNGKATSKDVLKFLALRRRMETEQLEMKEKLA